MFLCREHLQSIRDMLTAVADTETHSFGIKVSESGMFLLRSLVSDFQHLCITSLAPAPPTTNTIILSRLQIYENILTRQIIKSFS